ncbi:MAG: hypothetical protein ACE5NG_03880 [bacterium]
MNIYKYNQKQNDWQLIPVSKSREIGLDKQGEFTVGSTVQKPVASLMAYKDSHGKHRCAIIPYPDSDWKLNGLCPFSLHVLQDRDELSYNGQKLYFTYEQPAKVKTYKAKKEKPPIFCPRCKDTVAGPAVRCPGSCGLWYHQSQERECWTYDSKCIVCGHPTSEGLCWKPAPVPQKIKWRNRRHG